MLGLVSTDAYGLQPSLSVRVVVGRRGSRAALNSVSKVGGPGQGSCIVLVAVVPWGPKGQDLLLVQDLVQWRGFLGLAAVEKTCCQVLWEDVWGSGRGLFWSVRGWGGVLGGLRAGDLGTTGLSACVFFCSLLHDLVRDGLVEFVWGFYSREKAVLTLRVMTKMHFLASEGPKDYHAWSLSGDV